jgi:hypothetical protein
LLKRRSGWLVERCMREAGRKVSDFEITFSDKPLRELLDLAKIIKGIS